MRRYTVGALRVRDGNSPLRRYAGGGAGLYRQEDEERSGSHRGFYGLVGLELATGDRLLVGAEASIHIINPQRNPYMMYALEWAIRLKFQL